MQASEPVKVIYYDELLKGEKTAGDKVAVIGASGIGFDSSVFLTSSEEDFKRENFYKEWGIDLEYKNRAALKTPQATPSDKKIYLMRRRKGKVGSDLGKTTGWIDRTFLKNKAVEMISGVSYEKIVDNKFHILVDDKERVLEIDTLLICSGQVSNNPYLEELENIEGLSVHSIGGAKKASKLDAKIAIKEGTDLALII